MDNKNNLIYTLSKGNVIAIYLYFFILLIVGMIGTIKVIISTNTCGVDCNYLICSLVGSIAISVMLCSVYYIKCLYKACIDNRVKAGDDIKRIGNIVYFLFRPIFAAVFSVVLPFFLLSGMYVVTANLDYIMNERFVYLCMAIGSFLGFSLGKFLDKFKYISVAKVDDFKI